MNATLAPAREQTPNHGGTTIVLLLGTMLASVSASIATADWADNLGILGLPALGGLLFGWMLARTWRIPEILAHVAMVILGVPLVASCATLLLPFNLTYFEKLDLIRVRVQTWTLRVWAGDKSGDNLVFVIQLCLIMWLVAYVAAWFVFRRSQVWGAILPTGLALIVNLYFALPQNGLYLGVYILSAMLLLARMNLFSFEREWRGAAVGYPSDLSIDFLWYGALLIIVLMFLVWLVPTNLGQDGDQPLPDQIQSQWQDAQDWFSRAFSSLRATARPSTSAAFFESTLLMGGPVNLAPTPVMDIASPSGRYWRAMVYDKYANAGWTNTRRDLLNLNANDPRMESALGAARIEITQTVRVYRNDQNVLFGQSQPALFDLPTQVYYAKISANDWDVATIRARRSIRDGSNYTVVSLVSVASENQLRADSIQYSDWISATYLQLPSELPERVRALAKQIAAPYNNPYDQAAALEQYVREKIKYNDQVSLPPSGRDGVDYTLFDRPEGYCNYAASAMAVMARAIGIPARVVSGYTLGDYSNGVFHILESNAHSWVEIYFPTYGWIEYEPTANKPTIERPTNSEAPPVDPNQADAANQTRNRKPLDKNLDDQPVGSVTPFDLPFYLAILNDPIRLTLVSVGVIALTILILVILFSIRQNRREARMPFVARVYEKMLARSAWLGLRDQRYATPLEYAQAIGAMLPTVRSKSEQIALAYTRERFGAQTLRDDERTLIDAAWIDWQKEWRRGMIVYIKNKIAAPFHRLKNNLQAIKRRVERLE